MSQFRVEEPALGYWRVVYANPPINLLNATTIVELRDKDAIERLHLQGMAAA